MLSLSNSQMIPWAWSAYIQCYHKVLYNTQENLFREASFQKCRKTGVKQGRKQNIFQDIKIEPSYIDRMIPAVSLLGSDFKIFLDSPHSKKWRFVSPSLLHPKRLAHQQVRGFRAKAKTDPEKLLVNLQNIPEEELLKQAKTMRKTLDMSPRETMSYCLGMQEGAKLKLSQDKESKQPLWSKYGLTFMTVSALLYLAYRAFSWTSSEGESGYTMNKKDFQADIPDTTFDDVKGIDEVKQELKDVVEFLQDPEKFSSLGGKLPKGMLLAGPPGTGKTLLARAVAGEAGVPFYYASGSEFDEMFVGVGSARIRNLFSEARENAPCIIFIDEIDACGSTRTSSPLQPYARQTINQLLQEMDGFSTKDSVIVIAATNMAEVLDKALTRPGRFDTTVTVMTPDIKGRKDILELYIERIVHGDDLDLEKIARLTGGMTGAALENLVNQAALRAGQLKKDCTEMNDFEFALDKLRMGPELQSRERTEAELELTAFHEAGHALVAYYSPNSMPIYKATIRQRGAALGHVSQVPTREDETGSTFGKMLAQIDVCMGGRVAEEILRGKEQVTTGASSDLQNATKIAYQLVCTYGMSEGLGFVAYDYLNASPETKRKIEMEVHKLLENSYKKAKNVLVKHSHQHKLLAKALLKYETLSQEEMKTLLTSQNIKSVEKMRNSQPVPVPTKSQVQEKQDGMPSPI